MTIQFCSDKSIRVAHSVGKTFIAFSLILLISSGTSQAFSTYETLRGSHDDTTLSEPSHRLTPNEPSSIAADACLPLLNIRTPSSAYAVDRNQRSAGKAAALGLVFGVRFALTPPKNVQSIRKSAQFEFRTTDGNAIGNRSALAITAYRQCQKRQALHALNDFRWAR